MTRSTCTTRTAVLALSLAALAAGPAAAASFFALNPQATYLRANESPVPPPALVLDLSDLGFVAGDRLQLQVAGDIDNGPGGDVFTTTLGLFSSSSTLLPASQPARVPGALASDGPAFVSEVTYFGGLVTDIPEDFAFGFDNVDNASVVVTVPVGAQFLFLAKHDQLYRDNSDPDQDYGVWIARAPVPEPGSWALLAAGLCGLAWKARRHSPSASGRR